MPRVQKIGSLEPLNQIYAGYSAVPSGLSNCFKRPFPNVETLGYCQKFLRDGGKVVVWRSPLFSREAVESITIHQRGQD